MALTIKAAQAQLDAYISQFKTGYFPPEKQMLQVMEETGELARAVHQTYLGKSIKDGEEMSSVSDELMDVFVSLIILANGLGIDLETQFNTNMAKYQSRDAHRWERVDADTSEAE